MIKRTPIDRLKIGDKVKIVHPNPIRLITSSSDPAYNAQFKMYPEDRNPEDLYTIKSFLIGTTGFVTVQLAGMYTTVGSMGQNKVTVQVTYSANNDWGVYLPGSDTEKKQEDAFTLDFNYSLNASCWNAKLEASMVQKARETVEGKVRRSYREWPYNKILTHKIIKEEDKIVFNWETISGVKK